MAELRIRECSGKMALPEGRRGVLGGTFNPVHIGHIRLAQEVAETLRLSGVDLMPCASPPHKPKNGLLPYALRVEMLKSALQEMNLLDVSLLEDELPQPSYTWNTARIIRERTGEVPLFILGDEDFACLDTWWHGLELPSVMDFAVVPRSGTSSAMFLSTLQRFWPEAEIFADREKGVLQAIAAPGRSCWFLPLPTIEISATRIRSRWLNGLDIHFLVPDVILRMMQERSEEIAAIWKAATSAQQV